MTYNIKNMINRLVFATIMICSCTATHALDNKEQIAQMQRDIKALKIQQSDLKLSTTNKLKEISAKQKSAESHLDSINKEIIAINDSIKVTRTSLTTDIVKTNYTLQQNEKNLSSDIKGYSIIAGLTLLILTTIAGFIFYLLRKRMTNNRDEIICIRSTQDELSKAQRKIEEESVKLDNKLVELIEKQLSTSDNSLQVEPDHSLALKVADEIVRIELNLSRMDSSVRGYKQLSKAVERIKNNFFAKGYEITDMLNKPYNEGMRINADFVIDEDLPLGSCIITSITKPEVIYNGVMIQKATVTISQNI